MTLDRFLLLLLAVVFEIGGSHCIVQAVLYLLFKKCSHLSLQSSWTIAVNHHQTTLIVLNPLLEFVLGFSHCKTWLWIIRRKTTEIKIP
jgi:hypothetical protein